MKKPKHGGHKNPRHKAKIVRSLKKRWAAWRAGTGPRPGAKKEEVLNRQGKKYKMSPEARAKIAAGQRKRWKARRAQSTTGKIMSLGTIVQLASKPPGPPVAAASTEKKMYLGTPVITTCSPHMNLSAETGMKAYGYFKRNIVASLTELHLEAGIARGTLSAILSGLVEYRLVERIGYGEYRLRVEDLWLRKQVIAAMEDLRLLQPLITQFGYGTVQQIWTEHLAVEKALTQMSKTKPQKKSYTFKDLVANCTQEELRDALAAKTGIQVGETATIGHAILTMNNPAPRARVVPLVMDPTKRGQQPAAR